MTFTAISALIEARPTPTPAQYDAARRVLAEHAPDLMDAIFGDNNKENN